MSSVLQQFCASLNLPKHHKSRELQNDHTDETIFDQALNYLPIPVSFFSIFQEIKGISSQVLANLETEIGVFGQHMIILGRAMRWYAFLKFGPVDWPTIKPIYVDYFVKKCNVPLLTVDFFFDV